MADLVDVEVRTPSGKKYLFPDMPRDMLQNIVKTDWKKHGRLILVNVSAVVLSMEARLVESIWWDERQQWPSPA